MKILPDTFPHIYTVLVHCLTGSRNARDKYNIQKFEGRTIHCPQFWDNYLEDFDGHFSNLRWAEIDDIIFGNGEVFLERLMKNGYDPNIPIHYKSMTFLKEFYFQCCE